MGPKLTNEQWESKMKAFPMLTILDDARIFTIEETTDGTFMFSENCDNYFFVELNKIEVNKLCAEILRFIGKD